MTNEQLYEAMGNISEKHLGTVEAKKQGKKKRNWKTLLTVAACLCVAIGGIAMFSGKNEETVPNPQQLQVTNPLMVVESLEDMEQYLDYDVAVLDKEVDKYIVLVINSLPQVGRIMYADGSIYNVQYGGDDISGIYGGELAKEEEISGITVSYYSYGELNYAIWKTGNFAHSLTGGSNLESEVKELIKQIKE